jgi:hypothetical protein
LLVLQYNAPTAGGASLWGFVYQTVRSLTSLHLLLGILISQDLPLSCLHPRSLNFSLRSFNACILNTFPLHSNDIQKLT